MPQDTVRATASKPDRAPVLTADLKVLGGGRGQQFGLPSARWEQVDNIKEEAAYKNLRRAEVQKQQTGDTEPAAPSALPGP